MIEILETERLRLRRPAARDAAGYIAFARSQRARHSIYAKTTADAWRCFCVELGHWDLRGYGMFAVTTHDDDSCLGIVGPWFPEGWPEREIGWLLWPAAEGKGYGFEAARACVGHVFTALGWKTAVSYIAEDNARSITLAEKLGATLDPGAPTLDPGCRVYRHPSPAGHAS